jgi:hypothetical protein
MCPVLRGKEKETHEKQGSMSKLASSFKALVNEPWRGAADSVLREAEVTYTFIAWNFLFLYLVIYEICIHYSQTILYVCIILS